MIYTKRKDHETTGALLRRFTRRVQQSGILLQARKKRFHKGTPTKRQVRASALRKLAVVKERQRLAKLGKLSDEKRDRR